MVGFVHGLDLYESDPSRHSCEAMVIDACQRGWDRRDCAHRGEPEQVHEACCDMIYIVAGKLKFDLPA